MYTVFVNEKALLLSDVPLEGYKNIAFENESTFSVALDMLAHDNGKGICVFHFHLEKLWNDFASRFKKIEAAGGLVTNSEKKLLVIHRLGKWDLPKGKVEKGESIEEAAVREVEEECNINSLHIIDFFQTTYHVYFEKELVLKSTYWYRMQHEGNQTPKPQKEEGIDEVKWISTSEICELKNNTYENIKLLFYLYENEK